MSTDAAKIRSRLGQEIQVIVEDVDPNGKISLKPVGDAPSKPAPAAPTAIRHWSASNSLVSTRPYPRLLINWANTLRIFFGWRA